MSFPKYLVVALILLVGCKKSDETKIVGKWVTTDQMIGFMIKEDHTFTIPGEEATGSWKLEDHRLTTQVLTVRGMTEDKMEAKVRQDRKANIKKIFGPTTFNFSDDFSSLKSEDGSASLKKQA